MGLRWIGCAFVLLGLGGCASLRSAYMTNVSAPAQAGTPVKAEVSKWVFLAFTFDNDFALGAREKLMDDCPNGKVTGVFTTYESYWYLLFTKQVVSARGICLKRRKS